MSMNLAHAWDGRERRTLPRPSGHAAKAALKAELPGTSVRSLPDIAKDVVQERVKQEAAAEQIGISAGRLSSKLSDGSLTLKQLDALGDDVLVATAEEILETRGRNPVAVIRQAIRDARKAMEIIEQGVDFLSE